MSFSTLEIIVGGTDQFQGATGYLQFPGICTPAEAPEGALYCVGDLTGEITIPNR